METESGPPTTSLWIIPYHCEELANRADLEPLAKALAEMQGTDASTIRIDEREPQDVNGVEAFIHFCVQLSNDPYVRTVAGTIVTGALAGFGKKFGEWCWEYLLQRWRGAERSVLSSLDISPPAGIPRERCFPISVEIGVGPIDYNSDVYIPSGKNRVELENTAETEFRKIALVVGALHRSWYDGKDVPLGVTFATIRRGGGPGDGPEDDSGDGPGDDSGDDYWISAHIVQSDGLDVQYRGTVTHDRKLKWLARDR